MVTREGYITPLGFNQGVAAQVSVAILTSASQSLIGTVSSKLVPRTSVRLGVKVPVHQVLNNCALCPAGHMCMPMHLATEVNTYRPPLIAFGHSGWQCNIRPVVGSGFP